MNVGLIALSAALATISFVATAIAEASIAFKAIEGMYRNPEVADKLRMNMIIAMSIVETSGIYGLLVSILIIFVLGAK